MIQRKDRSVDIPLYGGSTLSKTPGGRQPRQISVEQPGRELNDLRELDPQVINVTEDRHVKLSKFYVDDEVTHTLKSSR